MDWAKKKKGGDLPDRIEQAMLFARHKDKFQPAWYWSNTTYTGRADCAWVQGFRYGDQSLGHKILDRRCRAVRRVSI